MLGSRTKNLLALSGVISVAAIIVFAGTAFQRSRAVPAVIDPPISSEAPPESAAVPASGAATGVVTAAVHMAGVENEEPARGGRPEWRCCPAGHRGQRVAFGRAVAVDREEAVGSAPPRTTGASGTPPRKPPGATPLPVGLPRNRDGK